MNIAKESFPALENKTYFNYGGQGPLPSSSLEEIIKSWKIIQELGPFTNDIWTYINKEVDTTRGYLSVICGVPKHQITLTENVTTGCILALWGLQFEHGDHILISDCEHPGIVAACRELARRKNLYIDIFKVSNIRYGIDKKGQTTDEVIASLNQSLGQKTKLVVISHILWNTGQIMPIKEIGISLKRQNNKPYLLVDAAQSFGQIDIKESVIESDIYAFTGHKWACGPEGLGGVAFSERIINEINPTMIGWKSLKAENSNPKNLPPGCFHKDSRKYEVATSCTPLLAGLRNSINLFNQIGNPQERLSLIRELSKRLWLELKNINNNIPILEGPPPCGLVSFNLNNNNNTSKVVKELGRKKIWIRDLLDPQCLRACLHVTTKESEIQKLIENLRILIK